MSMLTRAALAMLYPATLVTLGACKHDDGRAVGTAEIHSGSTNGVRVTGANVDRPEALETNVTAERLATALCRHDITCHDATFQLSTEVLSEREASCISELREPAKMNIDRWECEPAAQRAGFKDCLAAIANESCSSRLLGDGLVAACRPAEICRPR